MLAFALRKTMKTTAAHPARRRGAGRAGRSLAATQTPAQPRPTAEAGARRSCRATGNTPPVLYGIPSTKRKCLRPDEVEDFLTRPCNRHYTCIYPTKQIGGGKLVLDGYWQNKEGQRAKVHAQGTYQPKSFSIKANGTAIGGLPFMASMDAKWLGACPAGA